MGEATVALFRPEFNRAVTVERSPTCLTEDTGSLLLREASRLLGLDDLLRTLPDARRATHVEYSLAELVRTRVLLLALGWADQGDANTLRFDPALRLAVSDRAGAAALAEDAHLPSQPTLSRMQHALSGATGTAALEGVLRRFSLRRIRTAERKGERFVFDVDTLPLEVHGHQDGASYNAHYGCVCFQPLIAFAESGDLLGVQLRGGGNPTAEEQFAFIEKVIDGARAEGFQRVCVRIDCGFANGHVMRELDKKKAKFITRLRTTKALTTRTEAWYQRTLEAWRRSPAASAQSRTATYEMWQSPQKGGRVRRIIAVAVEPAPGELFGKRFFLCTNFARPEAGSEALLAFYRQRGTGETYIGEFVRGAVPALRAVPRGPDKTRVGMADNHVALVLAALAYELLHHLRRGVERVRKEGWSLQRMRERLLKVATSIVRHARQVVFRICPTKAELWEAVAHVICPAAQLAREVTGG